MRLRAVRELDGRLTQVARPHSKDVPHFTAVCPVHGETTFARHKTGVLNGRQRFKERCLECHSEEVRLSKERIAAEHGISIAKAGRGVHLYGKGGRKAARDSKPTTGGEPVREPKPVMRPEGVRVGLTGVIDGMDADEFSIRLAKALRLEFGDALGSNLHLTAATIEHEARLVDIYDAGRGRPLALGVHAWEIPRVRATVPSGGVEVRWAERAS